MKKFPLIYVYGGKVIDENGRKMKDWKEKIERFREIYIMDLDGISKNEPNLDFYQSIFKRKWIDAYPRRFEDVMDLVVAGADRIIIREGFAEKDMKKLFDNVEVELYLSLSADTPEHYISENDWSGFVYLLNRAMDIRIKEFISNLQNLYIIARRRDYIDFEWMEDRDIQGMVYPVWEMEE